MTRKHSRLDLDHLAYDIANFAHSEREPTSMGSAIQGPRPYYYCWTENEGMDILIFTDPADAKTAKLFRYNPSQILRGANLTRDKPTIVGGGIVQFLLDYSKEK